MERRRAETRMVKTSVTHPLRVDWLETGRARSVGLTIAPGKQSVSLDSSVWKRDLAVDIDALVNQGATHLVCLLEDADLRKLGLTALPEVTRFAGLVFMHFPIRDVDVPDGIEPLERLLDEIDAAIEAGGRVVIHCQGGLGRTGTVAGCYLVRRGLSKEAALAELVRVRRDKRCPETDAQRAFIGEYARIRALRATPSMADVSIAHGDARPSPAPRPSWYLHSWLDGNVDDSLTELRADVQRGKKSGREVGVEVARIESVVREGGASHFDFNIYGSATLRVDNQRFRAGHFETPTLGELRGRLPLRARGSVGHALRLSVVEGIDILTDIGTLQATAPEGTLFQVASQFNCLEAPSSAIVPVARYVSDPTQGPRAAISAFPGALLRHYAAPLRDGRRIVQADAGEQVDLLADAVPEAIAKARSGYLSTSEIFDRGRLSAVLEERFDDIRIGVHDDIDVAYGNDWGGPVLGHGRIAQSLTSTVALGGYSSGAKSPELDAVARQLLRAAYLGTILAAASLRKRTVVLTLIGGGVFGNSHETIWSAILWAFDRATELVDVPLDVVVNARELSATVPAAEILAAVGDRRGRFVGVG